jgi:DNA repair protein RecO (recombination protein O)
MEFQDDAFVLAARSHGETGALVDLLTRDHGRILAYVAGGASRKMKPHLQPGSRVLADYRARTTEHLGSVRLEPVGEGASALFDDPLALQGLTAAAAVAQGALHEREPHPGAFLALEALAEALVHREVWPAVFVRYELGLLDALGFGLDLKVCAVTGATEKLVWVSPRTGHAVSLEAGLPYADRLLALPGFLVSSRNGLEPGDIGKGFILTGFFLERHVFHPMDKPLPEARERLVEKLGVAGLL